MSNKFHQTRSKHRRIAILRTLEEQRNYTLNTSLLRDFVNALGFDVSRADLATELAWLADQGLVTVVEATATVRVATLTGDGEDVASGRREVPGIKRPGPRD